MRKCFSFLPSILFLAVGDLYLLPNGDSYDWDAGGDSNFDIIARRMNDSFASASIIIEHARCDDVSEFTLGFSNGNRFDVFPKISNTIDDIEHWRILRPDSDGKHTVCQTGDRGANAG